jgi:hypothetical protein
MWGQDKDVRRDADATDATRPPGDSDPKVALPARLMTPEEQERGALNWSIIGGAGGGGIVEVSPSCLSNDTRSSMEDYWRRRSVIVGAAGDASGAARFWENLFGGRDVGTPRDDAVPIPPGWSCARWSKPIPNVPTTPNQIVQSYQGWGRICTGPAAARPKPKPYKPKPPALRPPTPQTPRPALPVTPPRPPVRAMPGQKFPAAGRTLKKRTTQKAIPKAQSTEAFDVDRFLEWLEGQEALALELAMHPPDVRRAVLTENPEILYVWILLGWLELDEAAAEIFGVLAQELAEVGLSLFDFEEAARSELPAALAKELRATPLGLAESIAPAPAFSGAVAGEWDAASGVFLPVDPGTEIQRASYGYTPQAPRVSQAPQFAGRPTTTQEAAAQARARREARTMIAGCSACSAGEPRTVVGQVSTRGPEDGWSRGRIPPGSEVETRILPASAGRSAGVTEWRLTRTAPPARGTRGGFSVALTGVGRMGHPGMPGWGEPPEATETSGATDELVDLTCCPECALENMGPTARAWCAGIASPEARIGDAWSDFGRGFAAADRFLSENVWENVKGVVPYGNIIDAAHQTRMRALEAGAPEFYPSRGTASGAAKGASSSKGATKGAAGAAPDAATDRAITAASRLAAGVKAGDGTAIDRVKATKDAARAGDPEARRNWRVYVLVARDEHGAT